MILSFLKYSILSLVLSSSVNDKNIVETAVSNDNFSTLVAAVQAGDLVAVSYTHLTLPTKRIV